MQTIVVSPTNKQKKLKERFICVVSTKLCTEIYEGDKAFYEEHGGLRNTWRKDTTPKNSTLLKLVHIGNSLFNLCGLFLKRSVFVSPRNLRKISGIVS